MFTLFSIRIIKKKLNKQNANQMHLCFLCLPVLKLLDVLCRYLCLEIAKSLRTRTHVLSMCGKAAARGNAIPTKSG